MRFPGIHLLIPLAGLVQAQAEADGGAAIYAAHCASCHGDHGEGVPDLYDEPLHGNRSLASLARYIEKWMPEEEPGLVTGDDAKNVAAYIFHAFYSPEARAGKAPVPKPAFARLTNRQFRESFAGLVGSFDRPSEPGPPSGLSAGYFESDGMNKKARKKLERIDSGIHFDFLDGAPAEDIDSEQFSIAWDGSLLTPETGHYEFRTTTPNGVRFYLNRDRQDGDSNRRDDSSAARQTALIDSWVSSGTDIRQETVRVFLLGGRSYPIRLDFFKYKEPLASIRLEWKPPHGEWEVLAAPYLSPAPASHVAVITTPFPPDDASEGYERGTGVSKAWHEATTAAAIEGANQVLARLPRLSGVHPADEDARERLQAFAAAFAERAFRRPLDQELRQRYIDPPFASGHPPEQALKRSIILILKSPRFLYPELGPENDDFTLAGRLALGFWDSLPDAILLEEAENGRLRDPDQLRAQARRMAADPRAKAKLRAFFDRWLQLDREDALAKHAETFPGFTPQLASDLRRSLHHFVDHVVWSDASDYRELIGADYLFLNPRLAEYYQTDSPGEGFQPVKLDPDRRAGILTHPYLLSRLAHHDSTSPIHRGVFLTRNLLGGILRPPPEAISFENHRFSAEMTMREKISEITRDSSCMSCHDTINPLGFSLENFDATGRFRTTENGRPIDSSSEFISIDQGTLRLEGPREVAELALTSAAARRGFIRQLLQHTLKQNPAVFGHDTLEQLDERFASSGHIRDLFLEINLLAVTRDPPRHAQTGR